VLGKYDRPCFWTASTFRRAGDNSEGRRSLEAPTQSLLCADGERRDSCVPLVSLRAISVNESFTLTEAAHNLFFARLQRHSNGVPTGRRTRYRAACSELLHKREVRRKVTKACA
jgi:hypothetical protein